MALTFTWTCGPIEYVERRYGLNNVVTRVHNLRVRAEDLQNGLRMQRTYPPRDLPRPVVTNPFVAYEDVTKEIAIGWGLEAVRTNVASEEAAMQSEADAILADRASGNRLRVGAPWVDGGDA